MLTSICASCKDFNKFKCRSDQCKDAMRDANNSQESKEVARLILYELNYWHTIPHRSAKLGRVSLTSLLIEG